MRLRRTASPSPHERPVSRLVTANPAQKFPTLRPNMAFGLTLR